MTEDWFHDEQTDSKEHHETVDYRKERRHVVVTVGVLAVWIFVVLALVSRSTSVALTEAGQSLEYAGPLLLVLIVSVLVLVIFCLPSRLKGDDEEDKEKLIYT